jgi:predicted ATP-dependent endonuclease of OLD family
MKLHRLTLTNYRGITHRDIEFPEHGVVVVSGPNETGKSSMLEALDLLLEAKDRSTKKEV